MVYKAGAVVVGVLLGGALVMVPGTDFSYTGNTNVALTPVEEQQEKVPHIQTPDSVRSVYMSACAASSNSFRNRFQELFSDTELNAIVIDVKDFSGTISFPTEHPRLQQEGASGCKVPDMKEYIASLHDMGVYVIARVTVFQDAYYGPLHPESAVQKESDKSVWKDHKGLSFIDVGAREYWDFIVELSEESYRIGFDEINFDYVRYPSDGNMKDIYYPITNAAIEADPEYGKAKELAKFFAYLDSELSEEIVTSADLFGMTTTNTDDLNIGQVIEFVYPYVDYIAPMTYPSHYPKGFFGIPNPNMQVYDVMKISIDEMVKRYRADTTLVPISNIAIASTTPPLYAKEVFDIEKIRPWVQDFDYGGEYGAEEVRAQIQAIYDAGVDSWMLWDPSNQYTKGALLSS